MYSKFFMEPIICCFSWLNVQLLENIVILCLEKMIVACDLAYLPLAVAVFPPLLIFISVPRYLDSCL